MSMGPDENLRCDDTLLLVTACACKKHRGGTTPVEQAAVDSRTETPRSAYGPVFAARWDGECADCGMAFDAGDDVRYVNGELVAVDCCGGID